MSQNILPPQHAPPSALLLRQFALRYEALWGEEYEACNELEIAEYMCKGLHAFEMEFFQGNYNTEWLTYYVYNVIRVRNAIHFCMNID